MSYAWTLDFFYEIKAWKLFKRQIILKQYVDKAFSKMKLSVNYNGLFCENSVIPFLSGVQFRKYSIAQVISKSDEQNARQIRNYKHDYNLLPELYNPRCNC